MKDLSKKLLLPPLHALVVNNDERAWEVNHVKTTNGIACWDDLDSTYVNKSGKTGTACPTLGDVSKNTKSSFSLSYEGSSPTYSETKLGIYTKMVWTRLAYTITFTGFSGLIDNKIYLSSRSTLTYKNIARFGIPLDSSGGVTYTWKPEQGLLVNNEDTVSDLMYVKPPNLVCVFGFDSPNLKYFTTARFALMNGDQTVAAGSGG